MNQQDLFKAFPIRRIKPYDGMVVTSDVWEEAHDYHRQQLRYHNLLQHGPGILTGLEVIASDPPDSSVYIQPGIAVDSAGQLIVVSEALSYDLGVAQGSLYLVLSHDESQPRPDDGMGVSTTESTDVMLFVRTQYGLEAVGTPPAPIGPYVELARILRRGADAPITTAGDVARPDLNQIDLRFRQHIGFTPQPVIKLAVCYAGKTTARAAKRHGHGVNRLCQALRHAGQQAWMDDEVELVPGANLSEYTLVNVVAQDSFQFSPDEMNLLYAYLQAGGTLLLEACRQGANASAIEATFLDMLASFGVSVTELPAEHDVLTEPNFFAVPPAGFETEDVPMIKVSEGIIVSTYDYGCLWQGERRGRTATREEIRAAQEWGANLAAYAVARRQQAT